MANPFIISFLIALISEVADKTQLVILGLSLKYKSSLKVFSGALLAHAIMDGIAIFLGTFFGFALSLDLIKNLVGFVFIMLGLWIFVKLYIKTSKKENNIYSKNPFLVSFLIVLFSEFGDKTQISSGLLAANYLAPFTIFFGFVLALGIAIGFNVFIGSRLAEKIPRKTIKIITAVLFILFGIFTLLKA